MKLNYKKYATALSKIDSPNTMQWDGNLFLPPCICCSPIKTHCPTPQSVCTEALSSTIFNYKSTNDINETELTNLKQYVRLGAKSRTEHAYFLCNKYSLDPIFMMSKLQLSDQSNGFFSPNAIFNSTEFKAKVELLKGDLHVLSPFNLCSLTFKINKKTNHHLKFIAQCSQGNVYRPPKDQDHTAVKQQRKGNTTKPASPATRCPFKVNFYFDLKTLRWHIKVSNQITHMYHHPTNTKEFILKQHHLTMSMQEELVKLNSGSTSTSTQANILLANNNAAVSRHVLYSNKIAQENEDLKGMTDASKLVKALESRNDVTHFALYGESINTPMLTIPSIKRAKRINSGQKNVGLLSTQQSLQLNDKKTLSSLLNRPDQSNLQSTIPRSDLSGSAVSHSLLTSTMNTNYNSIPLPRVMTPHINNISIKGEITNRSTNCSNQPTTSMFNTTLDTHQLSTLKNILVREQEGLLNKDGKIKVLLACGWARNDDIAVLRKFPEVLHMDSTFKTNREGRSLFNIVVKDANNHLRTVFRCLLPSEKQCVFDTILSSVMPNILGEETCRRVQYIVTDGDSQEINAVRNACKYIFPNAVHNTCLWHMIILAFNHKIKTGHERLKHVLRSWLWYTATNAETHDERKALLAHLKVCLYVFPMSEIQCIIISLHLTQTFIVLPS